MASQTMVIPIRSADQDQDRARTRRRGLPRGRPVDAELLAGLPALLGLTEGEAPRRDLLIEYLHRIQDAQGQLSTPQLAALAHWMRLSQAEVYEVASFYHHFDIVRPDDEGRLPDAPALTVRVCDGLPCEMAGAGGLLERLPALLGPQVRVLAAPCVGRCAQAPVVVVHQQPVDHASASAVQQEVDACPRPALRQVPRAPAALDLAGYVQQGGYAMLRAAVQGQLAAESVLASLDDAGLRGLGGAGFPAGRKWRIVREQAAPRLMAVNIDEGEPGTFKDRWYLEQDPHRFLEGMLLAAWAVDITATYVYLRDEYHAARRLLERSLAELQAAWPTLLPGTAWPRIELRRGAGAYICGEESAMIESIEGKRGLPRLRPPYVAQQGLFGRPTLEHNFETLYWVRELVERGGAWFAANGRNGRRGLRSFSVSGRVREPGVKLAPAGITLRELVDEYCGGMAEGHRLYAYLPGGASGGILPAHLADVPLDFDTLQPHGAFIGSAAVIVLSQADRAVDAARNLMRFFTLESCGQCTPCRAGTAKALALMAAPHWDAGLLAELSQVMRDASICGLGQAAPNAFDSVLRWFGHELEAV